jgi:DNA primase
VKVTSDMIMEIRQRNPLREVMAEYGIEINKEGKACCPFHPEKTPSLQIYEPVDDHSHDNYHCYGCDAGRKDQTLRIHRGSEVFEVIDGGSDVIGFVQNIEMVSFPEACKILMERSGIPIPEDDPQAEADKKRITDKNREYWSHLQTKKGALEYLYERGLDDEDIAKWRLGLVPNDHPVEQLRNRIAFGLTEMYADPKNAKTIAMAYRTLNNEKPKYINDPTSNIYQKKKYLYGMTFARKAIRKKGYAIVMEGYFDVILAHKHGLDNSVATCGTSFTDEQMDELRKYTDQIFFWYDGDEAGQGAMERNLTRLLEKGFSVMYIDSMGYDPAEMLQKMGAERTIQWMTRTAKPATQVIIDRIADEFDTVVNKAKSKAMAQLLPILKSMNKESDAIVYKDYVAKRFSILL